ncbi:MAG TPA: acyloxyacyl hydrolase, partial [Verrucomicrobiae bacterium]|nr:acyloxyacyl hydrolase [Verrucomicrobiae bacterium]
ASVFEVARVSPFAKGSRELGVSIGAGPSTAILGSTIGHDITLAVLRSGLTLSGALARETYREGHWELLGEFFAGAQYNPRVRYLAGVLPLFRYNFTAREPLVPFIDVGAGVMLTDIYGPDLSGAFQFNEQVGVGAHYLFSDSTALTVQYRFMHVSNAGIREPNYGVNGNIFSVGITWFF